MRYKGFRIKNFKGVKDCTVNLSSLTGVNVFTLVGLNESGKTTILEAIHTFSPDYRSSKIVDLAGAGENYSELVPRHQFATFTGNISITAIIELSDSDKREIARSRGPRYGTFILEPDDIPDEISTSLELKFVRGDFVERYRSVSGDFSVRAKTGQIWRDITDEQRRKLADRI